MIVQKGTAVERQPIRKSMKTGASWSSRRRLRLLLALLLGLPAGCAPGRIHLDQALLAEKGLAARDEDGAAAYTAGCTDVLDVVVVGRSEPIGRVPIGTD